MKNPVRGFLHGGAALASVAALVALVARATGAWMVVGVAIYGASLVAMYSTSALYHSVPWRPLWKGRLQILDHTFIYVLVAATFTPLLIGAGEALWVALGLTGMWALMVLGLIRELADGVVLRLLLPLQVLAVSIAVAPMWFTLVAIGAQAATLTIIGGVIYLLGVLLFVNDRPRLAPRVFSHHEFFHVLVILASVAHFIAVWVVVSA